MYINNATTTTLSVSLELQKMEVMVLCKGLPVSGLMPTVFQAIKYSSLSCM